MYKSPFQDFLTDFYVIGAIDSPQKANRHSRQCEVTPIDKLYQISDKFTNYITLVTTFQKIFYILL